MRCLNDLQSRIACISNAWTTDLVYADPAPYKEEILKPLDTRARRTAAFAPASD